MSLDKVQAYAAARRLELPSRAKDLHRQLRDLLRRASDAGRITTAPHDIYRRVLLVPEPPGQVLAQLRELELQEGAFCIVGGEKNQERDRGLPHLTRDDGAWFDFSVVVREQGGALELLAYDFEIRLPPGMGTPFLRFDLNLPDHRNEAREMRCHLHPGSDDILVPAPLMSPLELAAMFIGGARASSGREKRRDATTFEVDWFRDTHDLVRRG